MTIVELLKDKTKKLKDKTQTISKWLLDGSFPVDELIAFAERCKDADKATCIESIEYATKLQPTLANDNVWAFVINTLLENAPRLKWESAKVIGNIAHLFPAKLKKTINILLINAEDNGTVVRWASAYALGEILKLKTKHNKNLIPAIEVLCNNEDNNGVKKKYVDAINKVKK